MVALQFTNSLVLAAISFLTVSAHPAIPALADADKSGIVQTGADRSVNAAWSLTIYSEPNGHSDAVTYKGARSSPVECKNIGRSSFNFDNLCDPMEQVGFRFETFTDGDCGGIQREFSSTEKPVNGSFRSWRVVEANEC